MRLCILIIVLLATACTAEPAEPGDEDVVPPEPCAAGTRPLEDGRCLAAGVPEDACGEGFLPVDGACDPILPPEPCVPGQIAVPGDAACRPVAPCEGGSYPTVPEGETAVHVDGSYGGGDSDGTAARPWPTIQAGIDAAAPGQIVAVAPGSYPEALTVQNKPLRLWGACPGQVEVVGPGNVSTLQVLGASGTVIRGIGLTAIDNTWPLLAVSGATEVVIEQVWAHGGATAAILVVDDLGPTGVTVRDSLVEDVYDLGIVMKGASLVVEGTAVRDVQPFGTLGEGGRGIDVGPRTGTGSQTVPELAVRRSLIERVGTLGIYLGSAMGTVEQTVIRDVIPATDQGRCIGAESHVARTSLTLATSVLERCNGAAVYASAADASITSTTVKDVQPSVLDEVATAFQIQNDDDLERSNVIVTGSSIDGADATGILAIGSDLLVESVRIRNITGQLGLGIGVMAQLPVDSWEMGITSVSTFTMRWSSVTDSRVAGVAIIGSPALIESSLIARTLPNPVDAFGDGLVVQGMDTDQAVHVAASRIADNHRAGIGNFSGDVSLHGDAIQCNRFDLVGEEPFFAEPFSFDDLGGNVCGCEEEDACKALTVGLEPPSPL